MMLMKRQFMAGSVNMFPGLIEFNTRYCGLRDIETFPNFFLRKSKSDKQQYFADIALVQFCGRIIRAKIGISAVLKWCNIFKIFKPIIGFISVFMINLKTLWRESQESICHKLMDKSWSLFFIFCECANKILGSSFFRFHWSWSHYMSRRSSPPSNECLNSAKITDFIKTFKSKNWFPSFHIRSICDV